METGLLTYAFFLERAGIVLVLLVVGLFVIGMFTKQPPSNPPRRR